MSEIKPLYHYLSFSDDTPYRRYIQVRQPYSKRTPEPDKKPAPVPKTHGSYGPLLFHPKWKLKRNEILARDKHRCIHCKRDTDLQIHHRQYHFIASQQRFSLPWDYPNHLLITLCESCHSWGHSKFKVPIVNI